MTRLDRFAATARNWLAGVVMATAVALPVLAQDGVRRNYIRDLTGVSYDDACRALFEVIDYVDPRRRAGKAYPAPVGVATMRLRHGLSLPEAEARLAEELS